MNNFVYDIPTKVYFGKDQLSNLGAELKSFGNRVLLTYGGGSIKRMGLYDKVVEEIRKAGLELFELSGIEPNPRIGSVREQIFPGNRHRLRWLRERYLYNSRWPEQDIDHQAEGYQTGGRELQEAHRVIFT